MPQSINRRSGAAAIGVAAVAIPTACMAGAKGLGEHGGTADDPLLDIVQRHRADLAATDAIDDPTQREIDAWHKRARAGLGKAKGLSAKAASALAILDLLIAEEDLGSRSIFSGYYLELAKSVRGYIASTGRLA